MRLDLSSERISDCATLLDGYETERASKFIAARDRQRYIAAHGQMRNILSRYLNVAPKAISILQGAGLKPKLSDDKLFFNLSHSENYALLAVSYTGEVGVDLECEKKWSMGVSRSTFSAAEFKALSALEVDKQQHAFFACWTRKEAFIKAIGLGFSYNTQSFTVSFDPDQPAKFIQFASGDYDIRKWQLISFQPFTNTPAALAFPFKLNTLRHLTFAAEEIVGQGLRLS